MPFCLIFVTPSYLFRVRVAQSKEKKKDETTAILQSLTSYSYYSDETGANVETGRFRIRDPLWNLAWAFVPRLTSWSRLQNITLNVSFEMFRVFCFISQKIKLNAQHSSFGRQSWCNVVLSDRQSLKCNSFAVTFSGSSMLGGFTCIDKNTLLIKRREPLKKSWTSTFCFGGKLWVCKGDGDYYFCKPHNLLLFCFRERAYLRIKEREVKETLLESKLSRAFNAWRSKCTLNYSSYFLW